MSSGQSDSPKLQVAVSTGQSTTSRLQDGVSTNLAVTPEPKVSADSGQRRTPEHKVAVSSSQTTTSNEPRVTIPVEDRPVVRPPMIVSVTSRFPPDGGFGWIVVFASFLISFIVSGFMKSFGAFRSSIFAEFPDASPSEVAWISGSIGALSLVASPLTCMLMATYGFRRMILCGGMLCSFGLSLSYFATSAAFLIGSLGAFVGIGVSFAFTSSIVCIGRYFTTMRPAAVALAMSGGCVGAMVLPPGISFILFALGLRYTFLVIAGLFAVVCICSLAFGPPEDHFLTSTEEVDVDEYVGDSNHRHEDELLRGFSRFTRIASERLALRCLFEPTFLLTAASVFVMGMANPHFVHHIPQQGEVLGATHTSATTLLTYATVGDLVARLVYGLLAIRSPFPRNVEYAAALLVSATSVVLLPLCTRYAHIAVFAVIAGMGIGVWTVVLPLLLGSNHGEENLSGTFATVRLFQGIANLIYPPVADALSTWFGTKAVLLFMGSAMFVASVLGILQSIASFIRNREKLDVIGC